MWFWRRFFFTFSVLTLSFGLGLDSDSNLFGLGLVLDSTKVDLTTALLHEYTDLYSTTWIYWSVYTRLTQHTPNARSCRCNQLYLDYNSRPSKLVCVLVWLWLLLSSESCSLLIQLFWATIQSVFTHDEKRFAAPKHRIRREVVLLVIYSLYIFTLLNMRVIILVNILYCSFISHPPVEKHWPKARSSSIVFTINLLGWSKW